jgi:hypothetical protein
MRYDIGRIPGEEAKTTAKDRRASSNVDDTQHVVYEVEGTLVYENAQKSPAESPTGQGEQFTSANDLTISEASPEASPLVLKQVEHAGLKHPDLTKEVDLIKEKMQKHTARSECSVTITITVIFEILGGCPYRGSPL